MQAVQRHPVRLAGRSRESPTLGGDGFRLGRGLAVMGELDSSKRLPTEAEDRRVRFATRSVVRYGPKKRKAEPAANSGGPETSLSGSSSDQANGLRSLPSDDVPLETGHRLRLEYTFVQGSENQMEIALNLLNAAKRLPGTFKCRAAAVSKAFSLVNKVQRHLGTADAQLQAVLVGAGARVLENGSWIGFKPAFLSPTRVLKVLDNSSRQPDSTAQSISFALGPWAGKVYSVADIFNLVSGQNWALLMTPVYIGFLELTNELIGRVDSGHLQGAELKLTELQLAHMVSDYWGLNTLLTFHNYTDNIAEVVVPSLPDDIKLQPSDFLTMAVKMGVTSEQLDQCMLLHRYASSYSAELATTQVLMQDILDECCHQPATKVISLEVLDAVEALRQIGLSKRALEVEVVHRLLFNILDPVQAAKFLTWIRVIVVLPISQWKEWMRLIYPCILGADCWMSWYKRLYCSTTSSSAPDSSSPIMGLV